MKDDSVLAFDDLYVASRRAYELGRVSTAVQRASVVTAVAGLAAWAAMDRVVSPWMALTFVTWLAVEWRGLALRRGARYGLGVGMITLLLPLSLLRPCCQPGVAMAMGDCCSRPGTCWAVGGALGLLLSWFVPRGSIRQRLEAALGMCTGVAAVAMLRCSALYVGEALGLLGGIAGGLLAAGAASVVYTRRTGARA